MVQNTETYTTQLHPHTTRHTTKHKHTQTHSHRCNVFRTRCVKSNMDCHTRGAKQTHLHYTTPPHTRPLPPAPTQKGLPLLRLPFGRPGGGIDHLHQESGSRVETNKASLQAEALYADNGAVLLPLLPLLPALSPLPLLHALPWAVAIKCEPIALVQPTSQPANQTTNQPTKQATNQPTNQPRTPVRCTQTSLHPTNPSSNPPTHQPSLPPTNQTSNQCITHQPTANQLGNRPTAAMRLWQAVWSCGR